MRKKNDGCSTKERNGPLHHRYQVLDLSRSGSSSFIRVNRGHIPFHLLPISWNGSWCLEVFNASTMVSSRGTVVGSMNRRETGFLSVTLINDFPAAQRSLFDKVITDVSGKIFDERLKDRLSNSNSNRVQSSNGGSNFVDQWSFC